MSSGDEKARDIYLSGDISYRNYGAVMRNLKRHQIGRHVYHLSLMCDANRSPSYESRRKLLAKGSLRRGWLPESNSKASACRTPASFAPAESTPAAAAMRLCRAYRARCVRDVGYRCDG